MGSSQGAREKNVQTTAGSVLKTKDGGTCVEQAMDQITCHELLAT